MTGQGPMPRVPTKSPRALWLRVRAFAAGRPGLLRVCALAAALLMGCFGSGDLAGGTSETTNGDYIASVTRAGGGAAARVKALLIDDEDWAGRVAEGRTVILDSAAADGKGAFRLALGACRRCNVQIDADGEGLFVRDVKPNGAAAEAGALSLQAGASLSGTVIADSGAVRALRLAGTDYAAVPDARGTFAFPSVAPGSYAVYVVLELEGAVSAAPIASVDLAPGQAVTGLALNVASERILVNDFEREFWSQTPIGKAVGGGWTATSSGSAVVESAPDSGGGQAYAGNSLLTRIDFGSGEQGTQARVGFTVDASVNLSRMKAFSFEAKGEGRIHVRFHSRSLNQASGDSVSFQYPVDLRPDWTHVVVPADSLALTENAPASLAAFAWAQAAKDILAVDFVSLPPDSGASGPGKQTYALDELYLEGMSLPALTVPDTATPP